MSIFDEIIADVKSKNSLFETVDKVDLSEVHDRIPTLIPQYDKVLVGGIAADGRITEIYGEKSTGKSSFANTIAGVGQRMGVFPVLFDVEGTTDKDRLKQLGVQPEKMLTRQPLRKKNGEMEPLTIEPIMQEMIDISLAIHEKDPKIVPLFIWDSIAQTQSSKQEALNLGDQQQPAMQSKALSEGLRKLQVNLTANNAVLIALNQARDELNGNSFLGPQVKTVGGKAWEHALSNQIFMKKGSKLKRNSTDTTEIGHVVKLQLKKSKVGANMGLEGVGSIYHEGAFDLGKNLFDIAQDLGVIGGSSNYPTYTMPDGTEVKKRKAEWGEFLNAEEGAEVFKEVWQKVIKLEFPNIYPALFNANAVMTVEEFPFIEGLREYYIDKQEGLPEERQHLMYKVWKENN